LRDLLQLLSDLSRLPPFERRTPLLKERRDHTTVRRTIVKAERVETKFLHSSVPLGVLPIAKSLELPSVRELLAGLLDSDKFNPQGLFGLSLKRYRRIAYSGEVATPCPIPRADGNPGLFSCLFLFFF